jgi:hypothetical protein
VLNNVNVSEYFYVMLLGMSLPSNLILREIPGIVLVILYFVVLPPLMSKPVPFLSALASRFESMPAGVPATVASVLVARPLRAIVAGQTYLQGILERIGVVRYAILINLILWMASLPIKMVLRWAINLKYIVAMPEIFFNI